MLYIELHNQPYHIFRSQEATFSVNNENGAILKFLQTSEAELGITLHPLYFNTMLRCCLICMLQIELSRQSGIAKPFICWIVFVNCEVAL